MSSRGRLGMGFGLWADRVLAGLTPLSMTLIGVWVGVMVLLPVVRPVWDERTIQLGVTLSVTAQAVAVIGILIPAWGWRRTATVGLLLLAMAWIVERVGSTTGFPFGRYHYTRRLQPQLLHVPLAIPVAWLMMLPPAWAVADLVVKGRGPLFVLVSAVAFTAWDFLLDPQMVGWKLWLWDQPGRYCWRDRSGGIPWINFAGWALSSAAITAVLMIASAELAPLPALPLLLIYGLTWLLETVGLGVYWQQPRPAAVGFVAMGAMLLWALQGVR